MTPLLFTLLSLADPLSSGGGEPSGLTPRRLLAEQRLCGGAVTRVAPSPYGGMSVKFMLRLAPGGDVVWKPEQSLYSARFEAEIAAHRLATHLGVGLVPPACERSLRRTTLLRLAEEPARAALRTRIDKEILADRDGLVHGAAIRWIRRVREIPPSVRAAWVRWLAPGTAVPPADRQRLGDVADLILLDLLFSNPDRFTGGNLLEDRDTGRLLMIDNGADFRPVPTLHRAYHRELLGLLRRVRGPTYRRVRGLRSAGLTTLLRRPEGRGSYLTAREIRALLARRDALVRHVEGLRRDHGDAAVLLP